ncbi:MULTISPECIES: tape measure protein [Enterobacter cloacae complex]|uniref:tape measure protein n=1 Tax=Enterobacter cloacae complex TaxID=354276 RepID=UPI0018730A18|nr:tape measure protein [Enterobacter cloacae complex sp. S3]HCW3080729.1 tape measure protein [Enterobacter asburiae]MBE4859974.1 tape measure protein [Enterobacter cloacae complex sp. S3]HCW3090254.1 tape measure protein [Enterobacter asburiae]HCW3145738.1 tape measure protein [Enterobacter asburiae]HCW3430129.1 tape measure protein [Enterobacter asburiae]
MDGTVSAGTIVYEVDMDTAGILQGRRDIDAALNGLNGSMGRLEAGLNRTERSLSSIEGTMSSLTGVAKALIAALSVQQVGAYAQAWQDLSNKLANAVRDSVPPFETLADVTERVFDISQKTRSGLDATATLYARLERSTRSYGVSVEDITRLTTIINQGFVVSGSTAEEASNAIIQLAQGLASGALRGDEFNSVNEQGNRLMIALADSMNVSIGALRNMAAEGKLTTDVIVNGLLSQGDKIGQEFAKTTATISQSLEIANNNITKFFGENATVKTGVKIFSDSVITLSENLDVLSATLTIVAGVMGARYVGALTMATSAKIADIAASRQQVVADNQTAQAALVAANSVQRKALADKEAALSSLALAQAEYNVAKGSAAEMLAMDALVAAKTRATTASLALAEAETAQAAASARAATAARAASIGIGMARGALALIGGPAGAAMLAAGAIFYFWQKAQQAKEEAIAFADGLDKLNAAMNAMSNTQLRGAIADANNSIRAQKEAVADLQSEVDSLRDRYQNFTPAAQKVAESMGQGTDFARQQAEVSDELARKTRDLEAAKDKLSRTEETASEATRTLTNNMLTAMGVHDQLIEKSWSLEQVQGAVAKAFGETADEINRANQAGKSFDPKALQISPATKEGDKVIATLEEQNELLKIQDERARAIAKARMQAAKVTDNQNQISAAGRLAAENYDLEKSEEARKKAQQESEQQGKKSASSAESVAQKLANLKQQAELAAGSTQELSREQAMLNAEQSLGKGATQAQIAEARQYAAAKWDTANALKAQAAAEKLLPEARENASYKQDVEDLNTALSAKKISQEQFNQTSERLEATHQANLAKIQAQQAVTPQQEAVGGVDPVQQLANENAKKLALIQSYEQQGLITHQNAMALRAATDTQYEQARIAAQWEIFRNQSMGNELLAASFDSLAGNASNALTGIITGSMSAQEAMQSLASNALNSLINGFVQMGVDWVKSAVMGAAAQTSAIATTTAAQTAGLATTTAASTAAATTTMAVWTPAAAVASIGSFGGAAAIGIAALIAAMAMAGGIAGKRKNGGPVSAGRTYQVGEGGMPEIYQASNGSQYMIPGDNGKVISNKQMNSGAGGSSVPVTINIQNYTGATVDAQATQNGNGVTIDMIVADISQGGRIGQAIQQNHQAPRKARG